MERVEGVHQGSDASKLILLVWSPIVSQLEGGNRNVYSTWKDSSSVLCEKFNSYHVVDLLQGGEGQSGRGRKTLEKSSAHNYRRRAWLPTDIWRHVGSKSTLDPMAV